MELNGKSPASSTDLSLEQVHKRVLKLLEQGHRSAYQIGRLYNYVVDSGLAQKDGFKDAQDFFKQRVKVVSQAVLSLNASVARVFGEDIALRYGMRNLYTLLTYAKLTGGMVEYGDPGTMVVVVPQEGGTVLSKPFAECSVEELQSAVKHKRTPPTPLAEHDVQRVQRYRDNLQRHFTEKLSIRVDARSHMGQLLITLRDIPEKEMKRLAAALVDDSHPRHEESQGAEHGDSSITQTPLVAPGVAHDGNSMVPTTPVEHGGHEGTHGGAPLAREFQAQAVAHNDNPSVTSTPLAQARDSAPDTPVASAAPAVQAEGPSHGAASALPRGQTQGAPASEPPSAPAVPVVQAPAAVLAAPTGKNSGPEGGGPLPVLPAAQGQGSGPRGRSPGLGGFLRRMTGG